MSVFDVEIGALSGGPANLGQYRGKALLVVNVASRCGLTPQYAGLQDLADRYADRGLVVLGVPCNQFAGQEPGTASEMAGIRSTRSWPAPRTRTGTPATSGGTSRSSWSPPTAR
jgi:glutathione peroxidase